MNYRIDGSDYVHNFAFMHFGQQIHYPSALEMQMTRFSRRFRLDGIHGIWHIHECDGIEIVYLEKGEKQVDEDDGDRTADMVINLLLFDSSVSRTQIHTRVCRNKEMLKSAYCNVWNGAIDVYIDFINGIHYARLKRKKELKSCNGTIATANPWIFIRGRDNNERTVASSVPSIRSLQSPPTTSSFLTEYWHKVYA